MAAAQDDAEGDSIAWGVFQEVSERKRESKERERERRRDKV
jgi:hypothetical protein